MQIEIYNMTAVEDKLSITLEAVCDTFSSLLWDIEYYDCGTFEVYIAATPQNIQIFKVGKIVGRNDDNEHFGIIESVQIETDAENGDYLIVSGRFLMSLLERRIITPTFSATSKTTYSEIVNTVVKRNAVQNDIRRIPGLSMGTVSGSCWEQKTTLQISYANLMEWVYTICQTIGGTANIRLIKNSDETYRIVFDLSEGTDRSITQKGNPHVVFSDAYCNLLTFSYLQDMSVQKNFAYIYGQGEGAARKNTTYYEGIEPKYLERYELYVDANDIDDEEEVDGKTKPIPASEYNELLKTRGAENLVPATISSETMIATHSMQQVYQKDYFVGDYVTIEHRRFGLIHRKIRLTGMIESFDSNGRNLTPAFQEGD